MHTSADPSDPDANDLGHLVMAVAGRMRAARMRELEPYGLAVHQGRALRAVVRATAAGEELRLSGLADALGIAPRSATEVADALEEKGLVARSPSPTDRRAVSLSPTTAGAALHARLRQARADRSEGLFGVLTAAEQQTLASLLQRILGADRD